MLLWFVIGYWAVSVAIGLIVALRVRNTADYAAAGHRMPLYVVTATVFATWFGSETVLGIPATFLKEGLRGVVADPPVPPCVWCSSACSSPAPSIGASC